MIPVQFEQANSDVPGENCNPLPACITTDETGAKVFISYWKPSQDDIESINKGGGIYLLCYFSQSPVILTTDSPFK